MKIYNYIKNVQKIIQPLALYGKNNRSYTNMSRSFSFSIFDENGNEKNTTNRMEFFIQRDPNMNNGLLFYQNVTGLKYYLFNYYLINLTRENKNLTYSTHLELYPIDFSLSYLVIYQFDKQKT